MKNIILFCTAATAIFAASCGDSTKTDGTSKDSTNTELKAETPAGIHSIQGVTLSSGTPTEIDAADLFITIPAGWNIPEPSVWGDDKGIVSIVINRGENSFAEISIEKTGKENLYATFEAFKADYAGADRAVLKEESADLNGITARKFIAYQDLDESKNPTTTGLALEGYYSDRKITVTSTGEDTYSPATIDTLVAIVNTIRVKQ